MECLCGLKEIQKRPWRYDTKPNWCQNYMIEFVNIKSIGYKGNHFEEQTENWSVVGVVIIKPLAVVERNLSKSQRVMK